MELKTLNCERFKYILASVKTDVYPYYEKPPNLDIGNFSNDVFFKEKNMLNLNRQKVSNEFFSRVHTIDLETDIYHFSGKTFLEKHISDFENIEWKTDYTTEFNSMSFNIPDLEVLSKKDSKYLSLSMAPHIEGSFQYILGLGTHLEKDGPNNPNRRVRLFMTESKNAEIPKKFIDFFFKSDFDKRQGTG